MLEEESEKGEGQSKKYLPVLIVLMEESLPLPTILKSHVSKGGEMGDDFSSGMR